MSENQTQNTQNSQKSIHSEFEIPSLVGGAVVAIWALINTFRFNITQHYDDFIVGSIAWTDSSKTQDLLAIPAALLMGALAYFLLSSVVRHHRSWVGDESATELNYQYLIWALPAIGTLATMLSGANVEIHMLNFSTAGMGLTALGVWLSLRRGYGANPASISLLFFAVFILALIPCEIGLIRSRLVDPSYGESDHFEMIRLSGALLPYGLGLMLAGLSLRPATLVRGLGSFLLVAQLGLTTIYLFIYPCTFLSEGKVVHHEPAPALMAVILFLIGLSIYDVVRRYLRYKPGKSVLGLLSPFSVFPVLGAFRFGNALYPLIRADDYHFGEILLGWWMYMKGALPYIDYIPMHGLLEDDISHAMTALFFKGDIASIQNSYQIASIFLSMMSFFAVFIFSKSLLLACISTFFLASKLGWFFLTPFLCIWLWPKLLKMPVAWLTVWILTIPIVILGMPAHGLALVMAFGLLALFQVWKASFWQTFSLFRWRKLFFAAVGIAVVLLMTPLGRMVFGAIRFVVESGGINQVAWATPYADAYLHPEWRGVVFELVRNSWVTIPFICFICLLHDQRTGNLKPHKAWITASCCAFFILLVPYTFGRIGHQDLSRTGVLSMFAWTILMPLMFWNDSSPRFKFNLIFGMVVFGASLNQVPLSFQRLGTAFTPSYLIPPVTSLMPPGFDAIGTAVIDQSHLQRLARLKQLMDAKLPPGEPYLDFSSRSAQYFYLDRMPPVSITALYNMVTPVQQKRAVAHLSQKPPRVALLEGENLTHDGPGVALRTPWLYRFALENYLPSFENGFIIGTRIGDESLTSEIHPLLMFKSIDEMDKSANMDLDAHAIYIFDPVAVPLLKVGHRIKILEGLSKQGSEVRKVTRIDVNSGKVWLSGPSLTRAQREQHRVEWIANPAIARRYRQELFQRAFSNIDLKKIPVAWGRSSRTLARVMESVHAFPSFDQYRPRETHQPLELGFSHISLSGQDAGLLKFDFHCDHVDSSPQLEISWWGDEAVEPPASSRLVMTAANSTLIVPLDAYPTWFGLEQVKGIRIRLMDSSACEVVRLSEIELLRRKRD